MRYALVELKDEKDEYKQNLEESNLEESVKSNKDWEAKFIAQAEQYEGLSKFIKTAG